MSSNQIDSAAQVAMLVPQSTRDNYVEQIRRAAVARGITLAAARSEKVKAWRIQHEATPLDGYNVLADWLEGADLGISESVDPAEAAKVRALESAKRDPQAPQSVLDLSDAELRKEIDAARSAQVSAGAPVITDDGAEIPASKVDAILADDEKPSEAAKPSTSARPSTSK
ncbi:hypothetical protein [Actinoplanes palleronii]|uniref:Uncharacterized protein n=1 Tax=Actinoplanes palleronii TaxID=113570 RepID=A0ABQ4B401_9ACTN|nr:hypothetical protein [Actinoplanes palleronii]GIE65399.1 hypothetical protein Apa02nite_015070 [Actinoplanes palleronii]